jgi:hypothetical protein
MYRDTDTLEEWADLLGTDLSEDLLEGEDRAVPRTDRET